MGTLTSIRTIRAPLDLVFETVAHIENYSNAIPAIASVEFLTEQHVGLGTRFRETRMMGKREGTTELEVTEYEPGHRVRLVADQGGTIWDTVFETRDLGAGHVELKIVCDARPYRLAARIILPAVGLMMRKYVEQDMDLVKAHCEAATG